MAKSKTKPAIDEAAEKKAHAKRVKRRWFAATTLIVITWVVFGVLILKLIDTINVLEEKLVDVADYQTFQERIDKIHGHVEAMHHEYGNVSPSDIEEVKVDPVLLPAELPEPSEEKPSKKKSEQTSPKPEAQNNTSDEKIDSLSEKIQALEAQLYEQQEVLAKQQNEAFAKLMMIPSRIKAAISENKDLTAFEAKLDEIRNELPELSDEVDRLKALIKKPIANSHDLRSRYINEVKEAYRSVKKDIEDSSTWQKVKETVNDHISVKDLNHKDALESALKKAENALNRGNVDEATDALKDKEVPDDAKGWFEDAETYNEVKKLLDDIQMQLQQALGDKA